MRIFSVRQLTVIILLVVESIVNTRCDTACFDHIPDLCSAIVAQGFCNSTLPINKVNYTASDYCRLSCNACNTSSKPAEPINTNFTEECVDAIPNLCRDIAAAEYCNLALNSDATSVNINDYCRQSCDSCDSAPTTVVETTADMGNLVIVN
jgi:hypothetical protein